MTIFTMYTEDVFTGSKKVGEIIVELSVHGVSDELRMVKLQKLVDADTGKLRVPSGWATDQTHLSQLMIIAADWEVDPDEARIILTEKNDGRKWIATVKQFMEHGFHIDRGFGSQHVLVDEHWYELEPKNNEYQLGLDLE